MLLLRLIDNYMNQFLQFLTNHWQLFACLVVILGIILVFELKMQAGNAASISPQTAVDWINHQDAVIIDIRDREAFRKGHIVNSQSIEPANVVMALTTEKNTEKNKSKPILVVCTQGISSQKTAALLKKEGFEKVAVLKGGINSWTAADLPLEKSK